MLHDNGGQHVFCSSYLQSGSLILGTGVAVNEYLLPEFVRKDLEWTHLCLKQ